MLRASTTAVLVLLGAVAFLAAAAIDSSAPKAILQSIGGFLIGTVVVSYAYEYFLREETEDRTIAKVDEMLERRLDTIYPGAAEHGFNGFAEGVPRRVFDGLGEGEELLWMDTYSPDLMTFAPQLRKAVKTGAALRMLVIDPDAETVKLRSREIVQAGYAAETFHTATRAFLDYLAETADELRGEPGRLQIRCYSDLPCIPMYLRLRNGRPQTGITGFYLNQPSFDAVHIKWRDAPMGMLNGFCEYFEHKWARLPNYSDSRELQPEDSVSASTSEEAS